MLALEYKIHYFCVLLAFWTMSPWVRMIGASCEIGKLRLACKIRSKWKYIHSQMSFQNTKSMFSWLHCPMRGIFKHVFYKFRFWVKKKHIYLSQFPVSCDMSVRSNWYQIFWTHAWKVPHRVHRLLLCNQGPTTSHISDIALIMFSTWFMRFRLQRCNKWWI